MAQDLLRIEGVDIAFKTAGGMARAVRQVDLTLPADTILGLVGESGSGKSTLLKAIIRVMAPNACTTAGRILFQGHDIVTASHAVMRKLRWRHVSMIPQSAMNALNPVQRIGPQIAEAILEHEKMSRAQALARAADMLQRVGVDPTRMRDYPHQFSGGMRQRVLIALSLLLEPQLLILDEPTTALDVLTQRSVIDVLRELRAALKFSMIFISHDLALASELVDRMATYYAGTIVEIGDTRGMFNQSRHPYTGGLLRSLPTLESERDSLASIPGSPPDLIDLPEGCKFHARCNHARAKCSQAEPVAEDLGNRHEVKCHYWREIAGARADSANAQRP